MIEDRLRIVNPFEERAEGERLKVRGKRRKAKG
jgi:hypothetical protein